MEGCLQMVKNPSFSFKIYVNIGWLQIRQIYDNCVIARIKGIIECQTMSYDIKLSYYRIETRLISLQSVNDNNVVLSYVI